MEREKFIKEFKKWVHSNKRVCFNCDMVKLAEYYLSSYEYEPRTFISLLSTQASWGARGVDFKDYADRWIDHRDQVKHMTGKVRDLAEIVLLGFGITICGLIQSLLTYEGYEYKLEKRRIMLGCSMMKNLEFCLDKITSGVVLSHTQELELRMVIKAICCDEVKYL